MTLGSQQLNTGYIGASPYNGAGLGVAPAGGTETNAESYDLGPVAADLIPVSDTQYSLVNNSRARFDLVFTDPTLSLYQDNDGALAYVITGDSQPDQDSYMFANEDAA